MQPKKKKKIYTTVVAEAPMSRPRPEVWAGVLQLIEESTSSEFGSEMSKEPPWRYVYSRNDVAAILCECSITIRDDGSTCNLAWSALIDPLPDDASEEFVNSIRPTFQGYLNIIAERLLAEPG